MRLFLKITVTLIISSVLHCVIPSGTIEPFTMSLPENISDTISPFQSVPLCFSRAISDTGQISFSIKPLFEQYYYTISATNDTVFIVPSEPFPGNTRFVIRADKRIMSVNDEPLSVDSVVFFTHAFEREPNNTIETSDHLPKKVFGTLSSANDTDYFSIRDTSINKFYIVASGSQTTFAVQDSLGSRTPERSYRNRIQSPHRIPSKHLFICWFSPTVNR